MPNNINSQYDQHGYPNIHPNRSLVMKSPEGMINKDARLEDENGISHQQKDLPHGIPLVPMMQRTVILIGDHPPEVPNEIALHIDYKDQQE